MVITVNVRGLERAIRGVRDMPKQIRFATAKAVNETAIEVQKLIVTDLLPRTFTLRYRGQPWWKPGMRFGFNVKFANRKDPSPVANVNSRADWLPIHETGGVKTRAKSLAVPQTNRFGGPRITRTGTLDRRLKPRRIAAGKRAFIIQGPKGRLLLTRVGGTPRDAKRRRRGAKPSESVLWYAFERAATIRPTFGLEPFAQRIANRELPIRFKRWFEIAVATAR